MNEITKYNNIVNDNSWRRWVLIKLNFIMKIFKIWTPTLFFILVSVMGTRTADRILNKYGIK